MAERLSPLKVPALSRRGSLWKEGRGEGGCANIGAGEAPSGISRLGSNHHNTSARGASDSRNNVLLNDTSFLRHAPTATTLTRVGHSPGTRNMIYSTGDTTDPSSLPSFFHDSNVSRSTVLAASVALPSRPMFRYGKDSAAPASSSSSFSFSTLRRNRYTHTGGAASGRLAASPPSPSDWRRRRAVSCSPRQRYGRATTPPAIMTTAPFLWRNSSVPPAPASRRGSSASSLLWGWGDGSGGGAQRGDVTVAAGAATTASPSPCKPHTQKDMDPREKDSMRDSYANRGYVSHSMPPAVRTPRRDAAYEEVREERAAQSSRLPQRRPPLAPSSGATAPAPAAAAPPPSGSVDNVAHPLDPVELFDSHNADEHVSNICRIARYLKDYYAREAGEKERGVESLSPEDVVGLAQCFYIDLYRTVRQVRRAAGIDTSSFLAEDPTEDVIASFRPTPPPPPQREPRDTDVQHQQSITPPDAQHPLIQSSATTDTGPTYDTSNAQPAFTGDGTHPVQIVTARLPAFRNDDTAATDDKHSAQGHRRPPAASPVSHAAPRVTSTSLAYRESSPPSGSRANTTPVGTGALTSSGGANIQASHLSAQNTVTSPPHRPLPCFNGVGGAAPSLVTEEIHQPTHIQQQQQQQQISGMKQHHPFSDPNGLLAASAERSSLLPRHQRERDTDNRCVRNPSRRQVARFQSHGCHVGGVYGDDLESGTSSDHVDDEVGECDSRAEPSGGARRVTLAAPQGRSCRVVKRPLKELMPLLRSRSTPVLKYTSHRSRPHLRHFQILDCMDTCGGRDVFMPHLTWRAPDGVRQHDRLQHVKRSKLGAPLPTGLSLSQEEVPYKAALNLIYLDAVYVGIGHGIIGPYMTLFRGAEGDDKISSRGLTGNGGGGAVVVVDHKGRPVAHELCAVFVFASRPVAVSFLSEDDRQLWVGAMMGVVERNRTLKM
ncbi:hypothetical protein JKF63_06419 [Porcisia hertigi]|uniref:PH domain-containing protein n=1 Tax=Porcisia hertigi TaxID=2761500 RepID=A0A836YIR1_9TRYP|nr:hypothetical protein JKF63_06419 [Porcisia hertigi]